MRTSLNLEDDAHQIAQAYAEARGTTLGAAVSELIRHADTAPPDIRHLPNGFPIFPPTGRQITPEMIKELEDEID